MHEPDTFLCLPLFLFVIYLGAIVERINQEQALLPSSIQAKNVNLGNTQNVVTGDQTYIEHVERNIERHIETNIEHVETNIEHVDRHIETNVERQMVNVYNIGRQNTEGEWLPC